MPHPASSSPFIINMQHHFPPAALPTTTLLPDPSLLMISMKPFNVFLTDAHYHGRPYIPPLPHPVSHSPSLHSPSWTLLSPKPQHHISPLAPGVLAPNTNMLWDFNTLSSPQKVCPSYRFVFAMYAKQLHMKTLAIAGLFSHGAEKSVLG
ncbi:hypothetical protein K432DRAFT_168151 [Lepidopterella palustris CBS 459.81]|uniref:Uncharacterized protein n=1 Tax=Lepidopterella palustris CBS 459.81 TaxID=1314670 RepID=A0A8E2E1F7_9PEZI|nr:hypothetical protein K432DRAFT_168151 [Lepidopterella palustris CBS 459.81]